MNNYYTPRKSINKAYLKIKPIRSDIEKFKLNLGKLLQAVNNGQTEEHQKTLFRDFFKETYYGEDYHFNTKGDIDWVINNGKSAQDNVGVLIEVKRTTNSSEMVSKNNINTKALQELLLYYLRERITHKNIQIKNIVVTNINEWFIFDANVFEKSFAQDVKLIKLFNEFELEKKDTSFFYNEIAKQYINKHINSLVYTYVDIAEYEKTVNSNGSHNDNKLIPLYKLFSPEHLLKKPFLNDSNSLNKNFYIELLHLIGLEESKEGTKKIIGRKAEGKRDSGSLLEKAILLIKSRDKLNNIKNIFHYGKTENEQLHSIAMELVITWINRILFLKLLEAQLIKYNKNDKGFAFLNADKVKSFNELDALFFQVLAIRVSSRDDSVKSKYSYVPYLNSSLFELTSLEHESITIASISDDATLKILSNSVLKNEQGRKRTGELLTINYLFEFLNAYDFASEGGEEIQEDNKTLINASVLGLIFEKINGYKDGSFFTPSFVTMYMCREAITKSAIQKFNEIKGWECKNLIELHNNIIDKKEANNIINSLRICDPAVGSGHFLVSALNQIIYIKSELKILQDSDGKSLKDYTIDVVNDELIITDENGEFIEYHPKHSESQRVQETLFEEKKIIIENCLFGVDINQNSVKICRLRLWIELLKNAYYKNSGELETLPNIDINIKCGNSLISRFALDVDLKDAFKKNKLSIKEYKEAVQKYRNANSKQEKREMEIWIEGAKSNFRTEIMHCDPKAKKLEHFRTEIRMLELPQTLFGETKAEEIVRNNKRKNAKLKFDNLNAEIEEIKSNKIYENALEWRFEFPEVLNDDGEFIGFDVVIGNPPYIDSEAMVKHGLIAEREFITNNYKFVKGNWDIYIAFFEKGIDLLRPNADLIYITPDKWLAKGFGLSFRETKLFNFRSVAKVGRDVFESANVDSIITHIVNSNLNSIEFGSFMGDEYKTINIVNSSSIHAPFTLDEFLSNNLASLNVVDRVSTRIKDYLTCENACATSDCYLLKEYIEEFSGVDLDDYYRVVNTGTLSKYKTKWGDKDMTYLKSKYLMPVVKKTTFQNNFRNTYYTKTNSPKLIIKGLTKLDVAIDLAGNIIPGKSTLIIASPDLDKIKLIAGILNSSLSIKYISEKYSSASYNGGVNFTKNMINDFPFPLADSKYKSKIIELVDRLLTGDGNADLFQTKIDMLTFHLYGISFSEAKEMLGNKFTLTEAEYKKFEITDV